MTKKIVKRTDANNETLYFYTHSDAVDVGEGSSTKSLTEVLDDTLHKSAQTLTNAEKTQVHANLGTESFIDDRAVRYDEAQVLGSSEKTQALTNLGLNGVDEHPTKNSTNMVRSGGVAGAIDDVQYARFDGIQETSVTFNTTTTATGNGAVLFYVPNNVFIYKVGNTYYTLWNNTNRLTNGFYNDGESTPHALTTKIFINTIDGLPYSFDGTNFTTISIASSEDFTNRTPAGDAKIPTVGAIILSNVLTEDDIINNLISTATDKSLSANQGRIAGAGWSVATYNSSSIGYISNVGVIYDSSPSGFYNYEFNVKFNEVYLIKTYSLINTGICVFKDADNNTLTDTVVVNTDGTGETNAIVSVPKNATKLVVCNLPSFTAFIVKKTNTNTNTNNSITSITPIKNIVPIEVGDSMSTAVFKLDSKISAGLIDNPTSITESGKEYGYITYSNGNITVPTNPNNSRNLFTYEVNEGQIWFVDMHGLATSSAIVAFYNSATIGANSYMKEYSIQSPGSYDKHYILNIPKGAVRMCLSQGSMSHPYRVRYSEQGAINYYNELYSEIQNLESQTAKGDAAYNILECDYLATGEPIQLDLYANLYIQTSGLIKGDNQQRNFWNIYACPSSNEDRWLRIDQFIGGFSSLPVGGAFLVDNVSQIAAGTTIPSSDILITPSVVPNDTTKTVNQSVFVPAGKILCLTHSDYISTSYCRLFNTVFGSSVINSMQNDIQNLQDNIDETVENIIDNKLGVDAIPDAANPLAVIKETAGYTAIFRRMGVIGGSMSSGQHSSNEGTQPLNPSAYAYSSLQFMARLCGAEGFNFSAGGMSAHQWLANTSVGGASDLFNNNPVQMYLIQLGNNDLSFVDPNSSQYDSTYSMGNVSDVAGTNGVYANTFYGKMGGILNKIREVQPRAYVFISTFLKGYGAVPPSYAPDFDYNQAARNIVEYYTANDGANRPEGDELHYYLIDYYTYGKPYSYYYNGIHAGTERGSHLVATGYLLWAYQYCTYIDWIIKNNMSDFNDVAFVGSDRYWN